MNTFNRPRLITPPPEKEEVYPYRRVWRSITVEYGLLIVVTAGVYGVVLGTGFTPSVPLRYPLNIAAALLPLALWLIFSWLPERRVREPRPQLLAVVILSGLAASAAGVPLVEQFLQPQRWLSLDSAINRIIGYTVTAGVVHEFLKYLVLRLTVPAHYMRIRLDGVAYAVAAATGYSVILNLHAVVNQPAMLLDATLIRVLSVSAASITGSVIVSYGIVETLFSRVFVLLLPATLLLAALVHGIAIPLRTGLTSAALTLDGAATRPYFGIGFAVALLVVPMGIAAFLYRTADRRDEDVLRGQE